MEIATVVKHPCAGMTKAQRRDFEMIAINERPRGGVQTLKALKARGLIEDAEPRIVGRDRFGDIKVPNWSIPLHVHRQWCEWCSKQPDPTDTGERDVSETIELQTCEHCQKDKDLSTMTRMDDCWFCAGCTAGFQKHFEACDHKWSPHIDSMGDEGQCCDRCTG